MLCTLHSIVNALQSSPYPLFSVLHAQVRGQYSLLRPLLSILLLHSVLRPQYFTAHHWHSALHSLHPVKSP